MILCKKNTFFCIIVLKYVAEGKNYDVCSLAENENLCQIKETQSMVICAGGLQLQEHDKWKNNFVTTLSLCYWPNESFNPYDVLLLFPAIEKFTLSKSGVTKILNDFPVSPLKELNISHTFLEFLEISTFSKLKVLEVLDLRYNKLRIFDSSYVTNLPNLRNIYLAGNHYDCSDSFSWVMLENDAFSKLVMDVEHMVCGGLRFKGKPLKRVMFIMETLRNECHKEVPKNCTCVLDHVIRVAGGSLRPMITVDCSYRGLTVLPPKLPNFTSTLMMHGNMISNLSEFITNENYSKLLNVYLDHNNISSINILAVSSWLLTFRVLSLRGNHLSEIPLYALENVFAKNHNIGKFLLSENPWKCDCVFTPLFKDFLAKYSSLIRDVDNVKCAPRDGDKNSLVSIISLSRNKICKENARFGVSLFNFMSICFGVSLFLLLGDFVRNYYMYKKYSKLPWMINHLPR